VREGQMYLCDTTMNQRWLEETPFVLMTMTLLWLQCLSKTVLLILLPAYYFLYNF